MKGSGPGPPVPLPHVAGLAEAQPPRVWGLTGTVEPGPSPRTCLTPLGVPSGDDLIDIEMSKRPLHGATDGVR